MFLFQKPKLYTQKTEDTMNSWIGYFLQNCTSWRSLLMMNKAQYKKSLCCCSCLGNDYIKMRKTEGNKEYEGRKRDTNNRGSARNTEKKIR